MRAVGEVRRSRRRRGRRGRRPASSSTGSHALSLVLTQVELDPLHRDRASPIAAARCGDVAVRRGGGRGPLRARRSPGRLADLDRRHAHRLGRLEVDAEVVEEHALGRLDVEQLAGPLVEAELGLADADLARLDDGVELGHHRGDLGPVRRLVVAPHDVVGQAGRLVAGGDDAVERRDHLRAHVAGQQREHVGARHLVAERLGLLGEDAVEALVVELGALQAGPRVEVGIGGVDARMKSSGMPCLPRSDGTPRTGWTGSRRRSPTVPLGSRAATLRWGRGRPTISSAPPASRRARTRRSERRNNP